MAEQLPLPASDDANTNITTTASTLARNVEQSSLSMSTLTSSSSTMMTPSYKSSTDVFDVNSTAITSTISPSMPWMTTDNDDGGGNASGCVHGLVWVYDHLGQCVDTDSPAQLLAFSVAIVAIALWIAAHTLMLLSQRAEANCSCSRLCLIILAALGSVCNLVGCTLCDQLGTQVLTAGYLVFSDVVFLLQWLRLWNRNRRLNKQGLSFYVASNSDDWKSPSRIRDDHTLNGGGGGGGGGEGNSDSRVLCLCVPCFVTLFVTMVLPWQPGSPGLAGEAAMTSYSSASGRKLMMVTETPTDNFGYVIGFAAVVFYTVSRIPTIINVAKHKTSHKEPLASHGLVIAANSFYLVSIVAYNQDTAFLINSIPWLLISLFVTGLSSILIFLVLRNRSLGPSKSGRGPVGRRRADGTFLLYPSEESLNSVSELRFTDDAPGITPGSATGVPPNKLPSIQEEPHLEAPDDRKENEFTKVDDFVDVDFNHDFDAETASIHSHASEFILDDDEDLYVRGDEHDNAKRAGRRPRANRPFDDDGLEWDFDDFRSQYTDPDVAGGLATTGSPGRHHGFAVTNDNDVEQEDDWDEEKVLNEIERELRMADAEHNGREVDADTISMEYDTADDDEQFYHEDSYSFIS